MKSLRLYETRLLLRIKNEKSEFEGVEYNAFQFETATAVSFNVIFG